MTDTLQPITTDMDGIPLAIGDTIQVFNPGPLARGTVLSFVGVTLDSIHVLWEKEGYEGYPLLRLVRKVQA